MYVCVVFVFMVCVWCVLCGACVRYVCLCLMFDWRVCVEFMLFVCWLRVWLCVVFLCCM